MLECSLNFLSNFWRYDFILPMFGCIFVGWSFNMVRQLGGKW